MRKVLSFVLVLSLVLGSFGMAFAATPKATDVKGLDCEDAVTVLTDLEVVSGYADGTYKPAGIVTRAEMATLVVKALGLDAYATGVSKFADTKGHWANGYIAYANSLGIVSGKSATTFAPNAIVTYDEAATMLIKALGFTDDALIGTWPGNYVTKAKALGILDGVKAGATGANRGDCAIMLYQTLDQTIGKVNKDGSWEASNAKDADGNTVADTMLNRLGAEAYNDGNAFILTDNDADGAAANIRAYVGAYVTAYQNSDGDILAIKETKSTFLTGEFNSAKDTFTVGDTEYDVTKTGYDAKNASGAAVVADPMNVDNGETKSTVAVSTLTAGDTYTLAGKVSGKKINAIYSVADWTVSSDGHGYFAAADAEDISEDNSLFGFDFKENDDKDIDKNSFELIGASSLDKIEKDDVVYVYANSKDKIVRVAVGTETVSGTVTKVNKGQDKFTISGKTYAKATVQDSGYSAPTAGKEVKLTLDAYGDVYDVDKISGTDNYAVVLDFANGKTGLNGEDAKVKLVLADGTYKTFVVDDESDIIDDAGGNLTLTGGAANLTLGAIIKYNVDKNGLIDDIDMPQNTSKAKTGMKISPKGTYDGKYIKKDAVIFTAGDDLTKGDDYKMATLDKVLDSDEVAATYVLDSDNREIVAILLKEYSSSNDIYGLFNGWSSIDEDGYKYSVSVFVDGEAKDYNATGANVGGKAMSEATSSAIIYKLSFDGTGAVTNGTPVSGNDVATKTAVLGTTPSAVDGKYFSDSATTFTLADNVIVYKWDSEEKEWTKGRSRDLNGLTQGAINLYSINGDDKGIYDIVTVVK